MKRRTILKGLVAVPVVVLIPTFAGRNTEVVPINPNSMEYTEGYGELYVASLSPEDLILLTGELKKGYDPRYVVPSEFFNEIRGANLPTGRMVQVWNGKVELI